MWIGLVTSIPLFLIALTGLSLAFLDLPTHEGALHRALNLSQLETIARTVFPNQDIATILFSRSGEAFVRFRFRNDEIVSIDANTNKVISITSPKDFELKRWLIRLHRGKFFGPTGQAIFSFLGLLVAILWLFGLASRRKSIPIEGILSRKLHLVLGLPAGAIVSLVAVSGAILNYSGTLVQKYDPVPRSTAIQLPKAKQSLEMLSVRAKEVYPKSEIESLHFEEDPTMPIQVYFRDSTRVYLDPIAFHPTKIARWNSHWVRSLYALHTGLVFGTMSFFWSTFSGAVLLLLIVSGLCLANLRLRGRQYGAK